jgi:hypothetical protein
MAGIYDQPKGRFGQGRVFMDLDAVRQDKVTNPD